MDHPSRRAGARITAGADCTKTRTACSHSSATGTYDPTSVPSDEPFSGQLEAWLRTDGIKTVGALTDVFAERAFAVTILFLMFIPALPLPTGGISHVFEVVAIIVAAEMVVGASDYGFPNAYVSTT